MLHDVQDLVDSILELVPKVDRLDKQALRQALEAAWEQGYETAQETVGEWYQPDRDH